MATTVLAKCRRVLQNGWRDGVLSHEGRKVDGDAERVESDDGVGFGMPTRSERFWGEERTMVKRMATQERPKDINQTHNTEETRDG